MSLRLKENFMKKITAVAVICAFLLSTLTLTACGAKTSDYSSINKKGYFVCGITLYPPMSYSNEDGEMTGFDTDLANAVAKKLGLEAKFQVITWSKNFIELNSGSIDCIWNGFTVTDARKENCDFSFSYMNNSQCVVLRSADVDKYTTPESLLGKKGVAEAGSAGYDYALELVGESGVVNGAAAQTSALTDLMSGQSDFAVIDVLMADSMVGKGDYSSLFKVTAFAPEKEEYAIGFRKGSDFTAKVNAALKELAEEGTVMEIALKYGLENTVITKYGE